MVGFVIVANSAGAQVQSKSANPVVSIKQDAPDKERGGVEASPEKEEDFYKLLTLPIPEGVLLEVGGMATMPDGSISVCTRRGDVWMIYNANTSGNERPVYKLFASGLHEPLGLAYKDGDIYVAQRRELTRLRDKNGDGLADSYDEIYSWPLSGNYHEYSYGPLFLPNGKIRVTLNLSWIGRAASLAKWRGWMLEITPEGKMTPIAAGMRSPAGLGLNSGGDVFYSENQGDWVGSGHITHVEQGDFVGHPTSLKWTDEPGSPVKLKPEEIPNTGEPLFEVAKRIPALKPPAVWLPHGILGTSTSAILSDNTQGKFGPFEDQLFVGDQGQSKIMRASLEKVKGNYQGVVFPFREGFASGVFRMVWGNDGSMFVGMTSRGWPSTGRESFGLQRLVWTGAMPFEMKTVRAMPDGFEIEYTQPVDRALATNSASHKVTSFTYKYHSTYGSPTINNAACPIKGVTVSNDGLKVRLVLDSLREGYIHEIKADGLRSSSGKVLLHPTAYYTLNRIPDRDGQSAMATPSGIAITGTANTTAKPSLEDMAIGDMAKRVTARPSSWVSEGDYLINLGTKPGLKFDLEQFQVRAGSKVKVVFNNSDDMIHNFVVVLPTTAIEVGEMATQLGLEGQQRNYIPQTDKVLYHTNLLQPNTTEIIYFTAPENPGDYAYVCSVPGHFYTMQGIMKVIAR